MQNTARAMLESICNTTYKAHAQAAFTPVAYRTGDQFRSFALAEYEKCKGVVKAHNLYEN
jgi:hypothetical protein